jgi:hypothetical protein
MYAKMIEELAPAGHDLRHIEVIMWLRNPTLDGLSRSEFQKEVSVAAACVGKLGAVKVEEIAQSLGFIRTATDNTSAKTAATPSPAVQTRLMRVAQQRAR